MEHNSCLIIEIIYECIFSLIVDEINSLSIFIHQFNQINTELSIFIQPQC